MRKVPEPERKPTELETARAELEQTQKALKKAKRRAEVLRAANERHARRTDAETEKIRMEWRKRNAEKAHVLPKKIATVKDVQVVMDNYLKKYPNETEFPKINVTTFNKAPSRNGGFTLMWASRATHEIGFNTHRPTVGLISPVKKPSPFDNLKNAFLKIHNGNLLGFEEEYALESFYHEINHTKAKKWVNLNPHGQGDYKRTAMETINQFVSRHQYTEFVRRLGGTATHQDEILGNGSGYARWVGNLRWFIREKGVSEKQAFQYFQKHLFNDPYDELDDALYKFIKKHSGTKKEKDAVLASFEKLGRDDFLKSL